MSNTVRSRWSILSVLALLAVVVAVSFLSITDVRAVIKDQFEIDVGADSGTDFAKRAYYHGDDPSSGGPRDDWATSAAIPAANSTDNGLADCQPTGAGPTYPIWLACNSDVATDPNSGNPLATCYGSRIIANPLVIGQPVLLCDGNSGNNTLQAELDIVSSFSGCSDQKTNDPRWCIKKSGVLNNPAKSDETHGYTVINRTGLATCPNNRFVVGGYERLGNEGTVFAGFIFAQKTPASIPSGDDVIMSFADQGDGQGTRRSIGDILVLLNQSGSDVVMKTSIAVADTNADGVPDFPEPVTVTPGTNECGSFADINATSVLAPPWLGNFCDPTEAPVGGGTGLVGTSPNQCRVIGNTPPPCTTIPPCPAGGNLVPDQDFVEFALDLTANNLNTDPCQLTTVIMTSRSSDVFTADLKDVHIAPIPPICDIEVVKTGDALSKVGDSVDYTITVSNPGNTVLFKDDISDSLFGAITVNGVNQANPLITSNNCGVSLVANASCTITATRTVLANDPDPLPNTVQVHYNSVVALSGIDINDSDDHSVNLFQPSITLDKTGDTLSKVGDSVDYVITLNNTSSADTPTLTCTVTDALLGVNKNVNLASGASDVTNASRVVQAGDPDPLPNTANASCSPAGFPNVLNASEGHSVNLFQPSITLDKTGDTLSKVGDSVDYTITLTNTSSADTPTLACTITDALLGINKNVNLTPGQSNVTNQARTVLAGDPDPLVNTSNAQCSPAGFSNVLNASNGHTVNLFQPSITLVKTGDTLSKIGDSVNYTITLTNTSSADTPTLSCTVTDALLGVNVNVNLAPGANSVTNTSRVVQAGDPDPLPNTANASCSPAGFPNVINASDGHSVNLFQPSITLVKTGDTLSKIGDSVNYTITLTNTSSADTPTLSCTVTDPLLAVNENVNLNPGQNDVTNASRVVQAGDADPLVNTSSAACSPAGFPNVLNASDPHSVNLFQPSITLDKTGDTSSKVGDPVNYTITLNNTSSADTPQLSCTITDPLLEINKNVNLNPGQSDVTNDSRIVQANDPDPLVNTSSAACSPAGFPNVLNASNPHSVNLFGPSITFTKTGDTLSKIGDSVDYTITLTNTSSADTPNLSCTVTDPLLGINKNVNLASGASDVTNASRVVLAGDPDPLVNTASVVCSVAGFPNILNASDPHSVNLFQPSITLNKTGDTLSKIGDSVDYTITLTNTSSADTPTLSCTVTDALLGVNVNVNLAPGANSVTNTSRVVQAGDPDPLPNTANAACSPAGFPNVLNRSEGHTVNLFQPSITLVKTGDTLSKVGDSVDYVITLNNTSSADTPQLSCTVTDALLGVNKNVNLNPGQSDVTNTSRVVQAGDPDPLPNTANASCSPAGFPNVLNRSDGHSVNLFQPCIQIAKIGDALSKVSDSVDYTITVTNCSSNDTPTLTCSITDPLAGVNKNVNLTPGQNNVTNVSRTVLAGDPDPIVNTAQVSCSPAGFPNVLALSDNHTVNLFQPSITLNKTGDALSKIGDSVNYTITLTNTSSADTPTLACTITDALLGVNVNVNLTPGQNHVINPARVVQAGDPDPLLNTANASCSPAGFPNVLSRSDGHSVNLFQPGVDVTKVCDDFAKSPDPTAGVPITDVAGLNASDDVHCVIVITNLSSADSPNLVNGTASDTLCGNLLGAGNGKCTVGANTCTTTLATGASCQITYDYGKQYITPTPDPLVNTVVVHYNPDGFPNAIDDNASDTIDVLHPNLTVLKDCLTDTVPPGGSAIFDIRITNTGDVVLTVTTSENELPGPFSMNPGATVQFEATIVAGQGPIVENVVNVTATLPVNTGLTNVLNREARDFCDVQGGATRTPGFWQTHMDYTCHVFEDHLGGSIDLGWRTLDSCAEVFGMFWANNAKESDGSRRSKICQARVVGSFQLLAAILNTGLDNGAAVPIDTVTGDDIITAMQDALAAGDFHEIKRLGGLLDAYNNSGDDVAIIDDDGTLQGRANPSGAKALADYTIADC